MNDLIRAAHDRLWELKKEQQQVSQEMREQIHLLEGAIETAQEAYRKEFQAVTSIMIIEKALKKEKLSTVDWTDTETEQMKKMTAAGTMSRNQARYHQGLEPLAEADEVA